MVCKRHAAWVAEQESAARQMRLANIKLQIRAGVYETPARILGTVQKLKEVLMPKHTPGPWHMGDGNGQGSIFADEGRTRLEKDGTTLYPIAMVNHGWNEDEDNANAALIAAAPDLLETLTLLFEHCEIIRPHYGDKESSQQAKKAIESARAAIRKAEGGDA